MTRFSFWIAVLLTLFTLCGCQEKGNPSIYHITHDGKTYTVDQEQGTIACDEIVYHFEVSGGGGNSVDLKIVYPDGSNYYWTQGDYSGHGGWSDDYDPDAQGYVPGDVLWNVLKMRFVSRRDSGPSPLLAFLLVAVGVFLAVKPQAAWMLQYGWRFENAEPSELALAVNCIVGMVLIFIGVNCLLASGV